MYHAPARNIAPIMGAEATARKVAQIADPRVRHLLFFLQSLADAWGTPRLARAILDAFPKRLGEPFAEWIDYAERPFPKAEPPDYESNLDARRVAEQDLPSRLAALCTDPDVEVDPDCERDCPWWTGLPYFRDLIGALFEFQKQHVEAALSAVIQTTACRQSLDALNYGLQARSMVLIEGPAGAGKSQAVRAWADTHRGAARLVELTGACTVFDFFRHLARELGVGAQRHWKQRVEEYLWASRLMVVIDEAQHLWGRGQRERNMVLVGWLDTALFNRGIPVAMFATAEFTQRKAEVESETGWSSEQLARRIRRHVCLPAARPGLWPAPHPAFRPPSAHLRLALWGGHGPAHPRLPRPSHGRQRRN